ncbi:glycoside hydrolase family 3 C-terminal domain-containing protein [Pseudofrankia sp. BMG5.37]|uniref:glycoside hydrolase family 3 C-terminal domain-containing protein n=1 Tax=Pseudofrankia sp. BMG5.37 TaxID=3050035 RepID=UPI002895ECE4|nr:glycoside hydrolase family 3 C-terminal domain-containing protein [Pseudofrankia sp. BMG5.37]MDT3446833.1 glycoside hydrolase family 3 C-terminal domain-containing protein [Pseudofrankia sp. BMG5.37]
MAEKAGLLFHTIISVGKPGAHDVPGSLSPDTLRDLIADRLINHLTVVDNPMEADLAIVRLRAPYEPRDRYFLEAMTHQGSLDFPADIAERIAKLATQVPVALDVYLDRPAILTQLDAVVAALTVSFGASDAALLDALSGRTEPRGRLPFELPRSMDAVRASRPDVPSDTEGPLYPHRAGLCYSADGGR